MIRREQFEDALANRIVLLEDDGVAPSMRTSGGIIPVSGTTLPPIFRA
jgi:hypothetical protein